MIRFQIDITEEENEVLLILAKRVHRARKPYIESIIRQLVYEYRIKNRPEEVKSKDDAEK